MIRLGSGLAPSLEGQRDGGNSLEVPLNSSKGGVQIAAGSLNTRCVLTELLLQTYLIRFAR